MAISANYFLKYLKSYSILRYCKCLCSSSVLSSNPGHLHNQHTLPPTADANLIETLPSWKENDDPELRSRLLQDVRVLPDFVTEAEEKALLDELEPILKRMRYEFDHWDDAIHGFRETERSTWKPENNLVIERIKTAVDLKGEEWLPHAHVLDLAPAGHIKPHIDAVRFCGDIIAGLCLLSSAVMELSSETSTDGRKARLLLPRRGLYVLSGVARYKFTHAVLGGVDSVWRGQKVARQRRISVICRSAPKNVP